MNQKDELLVTDFRQSNAEAKSRVQRFDPDGRFLGAFETDPMPGGLALDKAGLLYLSHMMKHKIAVYDPAGKLVREFGKQGAAPESSTSRAASPSAPMDRFTSPTRPISACSVCRPRARPISAWGKHGVATGEFGGNASPRGRGGGPHFVAFNSQGDLYTTEASVGRVQKFKPDGTFLLAWGDNEVAPGHFGGHKYMPGPLAVAVDHHDQVWVTSTNHYLHQFTPEGHFVCRIGGEGAEPGQFRLPHGLAFDSSIISMSPTHETPAFKS